MGNGSYNHPHHHNPHNHHNNFPHKKQNSTTNTTNNLLPMLCRVSIKDTIANHHNHPRRICHKKDDPSSPKVTCIGKVKKSHHPTTTFSPPKLPTTTTTSKHSKLRHFFSGKTYLPTTAASATTAAASASCRNSFSRRRPSNFVTVVPVVELNLAELDPPLPVIRRAAPPCAEEVSLWERRRCGGPGLRSLEIQPFQFQNNGGKKSNNFSRQFFSPTSV